MYELLALYCRAVLCAKYSASGSIATAAAAERLRSKGRDALDEGSLPLVNQRKL